MAPERSEAAPASRLRWGWLAWGLIFAYAAAVQVNDPDAARWLALYVGSAMLCILSVRRLPPPAMPAVLGVAAAVWAALLLPEVVREAALTFDEEERELGGLALVIVSMLTLFRAARRA